MRAIGVLIVALILWPSSPLRKTGDNKVISSSKQTTFRFQRPVSPCSSLLKNSKKIPGIDTNNLKQSDWYANVIKNIEESEYEIKPADKANEFAGPNRQQDLRTTYTSDKFILEPGEKDKWKLQLTLKGVYSEKKKIYSPGKDAMAVIGKNKIQFNHNNEFAVEYINSKEGVRQNFIISQQPANNPSTLNIKLSVNKGWFINKVHPKEIHFAKARGDRVEKKLTYNDLKAWDANNKELDASFSVSKNEISIHINTNNSVYPITIDPLSTTANWTFESDLVNGRVGYTGSISSAGDVNGDGYSDVILGAPWVSSPGGKVFLFYGSATGLSATANWTATGPQTNEGFGFTSTAGDVNGDGYSDVIIGAVNYNNGTVTGGGAFIYFGNSAGLPVSPNWTVSSDQGGSQFGYSVACAGDVNGDGYSDVIIGAYQYTNGETNEGRAYCYYGASGGPSTTANWITEDNVAGAAYGVNVASAGDLNGDGYSDVVVGAYLYSNGESQEGAAYVYYGSSTGLPITAGWMVESNIATGLMGVCVAGAGDVNGDGYSDLLLGVIGYSNGQSFEGAVYVYHGSSSGLLITPNYIIESNVANARMGLGIACAGDINGDGYSDLVVGAYNYSNGESSEGAAWVYYGSSSGLSITSSWMVESNIANAYFGHTAFSAGDINGDGYSDIMIGASQYTNGQSLEGRVYEYHGSPDGLKTASNWQVLEAQAVANYGISVASAGDVNSDGFSDVIVGAYIYDQGFGDNGKAYLYMGSATGLSTTAAWSAVGSMANEYFGRCVAAAGDVNGDGYGDVLVGAYGYTNVQSQEGRAYLYYGSSGGLSVTAAWTYENNIATSVLGLSLAAAGDVNGDGYGDIIIGAPQYTNGQANEGIAYLFYGTSTVPASTPVWSTESNQVGAFYGICVAGLGDVNGDGFSDVIIGAHTYDNPETDEGKVFAFYGSAAGLPAVASWTAESNQANAQFGISVASAGDVNGDGYCDAIVGAYLYDGTQTDDGKVYVYYGSSIGLSLIANWTAESNIASSFFGYSASSAGDVNGDGYTDVLVGAREISNGQSREGALYAYYGSSTGLSLSSSWYVESNVAGILLGNSVSSAGDVNGDGFSDIIGGAPYYIDPNRNGAAFVYYGNNNTGLHNNLRLYNSDLNTPIQQSNMSDPNLFGAGLYAKSFIGKQKGKLIWETVKNGNPFSGSPITNSAAFTSQGSLTDLGLSGSELKHTIAKQTNTKATYIRARVKYDPVTAITGQVYGPWRYPEGFLRGRRDVGAVALPVKFISFNAVKQDKSSLLKWITTDEEPGVKFEVQYSTDGISFTTLTIINGRNQTQNEYEWLHTSPAKGNNYYRIRAVEIQKEAYTATRKLSFNDISYSSIYPNPAIIDQLLTIKNAAIVANQPVTISLVNSMGQLVWKKEIVAAWDGSVTLNIPDIPGGAYLLLTETGQWAGKEKIVVVNR